MWFLLAMVNYPEALKKAQEEIDLVVGADGKTPPGFAHINDLPYSVALTKEIFRWMPSAPGGFPHYSDEDDEYKGYTIKGGTMVIPNIWAMQHNETAFPDPLTFNPDRFMRKGEFTEHDSLTDGHYAFGFGRRQCPGESACLLGIVTWLY
jgi:cytochrome P450